MESIDARRELREQVKRNNTPPRSQQIIEMFQQLNQEDIIGMKAFLVPGKTKGVSLYKGRMEFEVEDLSDKK